MAYQVFCDPLTGTKINTAIGCIPVNSAGDFVTWIVPKLVGIFAGISFLLIVSGGIQILTSAGNPQKIKGGSETITSAIAGLLFLIFSLFILRLIGIDILHIPGLQ